MELMTHNSKSAFNAFKSGVRPTISLLGSVVYHVATHKIFYDMKYILCILLRLRYFLALLY